MNTTSLKAENHNLTIGPNGPSQIKPSVIDTRPLFAHGETPCDAIDDAIASLAIGQPLVLLIPFEPIPLYAKLAKQGFQHRSQRLSDGSWQVEFRR